MVIPWCPKTPADHILGTHNGAFGYACSHGIACHTTISIIWHTKKFNLVKWGVELKTNWLNWSIQISWGFQFQYNSNSKSFNSIPIQFMLNWIELIINSNSIHELIRALIESMHKFRYSILFTFLMDRGRAPNGVGHLMILSHQWASVVFTWEQ